MQPFSLCLCYHTSRNHHHTYNYTVTICNHLRVWSSWVKDCTLRQQHSRMCTRTETLFPESRQILTSTVSRHVHSLCGTVFSKKKSFSEKQFHIPEIHHDVMNELDRATENIKKVEMSNFCKTDCTISLRQLFALNEL